MAPSVGGSVLDGMRSAARAPTDVERVVVHAAKGDSAGRDSLDAGAEAGERDVDRSECGRAVEALEGDVERGSVAGEALPAQDRPGRGGPCRARSPRPGRAPGALGASSRWAASLPRPAARWTRSMSGVATMPSRMRPRGDRLVADDRLQAPGTAAPAADAGAGREVAEPADARDLGAGRPLVGHREADRVARSRRRRVEPGRACGRAGYSAAAIAAMWSPVSTARPRTSLSALAGLVHLVRRCRPRVRPVRRRATALVGRLRQQAGRSLGSDLRQGRRRLRPEWGRRSGRPACRAGR